VCSLETDPATGQSPGPRRCVFATATLTVVFLGLTAWPGARGGEQFEPTGAVVTHERLDTRAGVIEARSDLLRRRALHEIAAQRLITALVRLYRSREKLRTRPRSHRLGRSTGRHAKNHLIQTGQNAANTEKLAPPQPSGGKSRDLNQPGFRTIQRCVRQFQPTRPAKLSRSQQTRRNQRRSIRIGHKNRTIRRPGNPG